MGAAERFGAAFFAAAKNAARGPAASVDKPPAPESAGVYNIEHNMEQSDSPKKAAPSSPVRFRAGFTLIELLVVISIVALLSSIVLASLSFARIRAGRIATTATLRSVLAELTLCANDGGVAPTAALSPSLYICATDATGATNFPGHNMTWPSLGSNGWTYGNGTTFPSSLPTGQVKDGSYAYSAINTSLPAAMLAGYAVGSGNMVTCSMATGVCQ